MEKEKDEAAILAEDIPDFPEQDAAYQVVVYGYDKDGNPAGYTQLLDCWDDPDEATSYANDLDLDTLLRANYPDNVEFIEVCVETAVTVDGEETLAGSIFKTSGKVIKK